MVGSYLASPRFLDNDVKYKKHKEQVISLQNRGVHGYNQDIICHIQIVSMYAPVFLMRMLNIKSIKNKSFRWKTGASMDTTKISFVIFKSYLCTPPVFWMIMLNIKSIKDKSFRWKTGVYMATSKISFVIFKLYLCTPPFFWMMMLKNNSLENGGVHGYNQDIICHIQLVSMYAPVFLEENEDVKYKKHKEQSVLLETGAYLDTTKISFVIFKSYRCTPPFFG